MSKIKEKIILGIDPGTTIMGYGVILVKDSLTTILQYGVIHLNKFDSHALRLLKIFQRVLTIIDEYHPDHVALEAPFYGKNVQAMLKLGRAQGVAMAAALYRNIPIHEYAPRKVKQSVTGNGNASKEQISKMMMNFFKMEKQPKWLDATDALAVALCHHHQKEHIEKKPSWESFVKNNPDRIQ